MAGEMTEFTSTTPRVPEGGPRHPRSARAPQAPRTRVAAVSASLPRIQTVTHGPGSSWGLRAPRTPSRCEGPPLTVREGPAKGGRCQPGQRAPQHEEPQSPPPGRTYVILSRRAAPASLRPSEVYVSAAPDPPEPAGK